jgi:hypothetical protein
MDEPEKVRDWLRTGINYLMSKSGDGEEVSNYQPITYLTTMYQTLTGITARRISIHQEEQDLLPAKQKGYHRGKRLRWSRG